MKKENIQILFLLLMFMAIAALLAAIFIVGKNIKELKAEPMQYSMERYSFDSCVCYKGLEIFHYNNDLGEEEEMIWDNKKS